MNSARSLFENYWINKTVDRELYNKARRELANSSRFIREQLGWKLINNERILKLEKIPAYAQSFMGITKFSTVKDYCILCALLIFLEDKEDDEQFLLSEMVAMIEIQLKDYMEVDWTIYTQRKSLIRALQFAERMGMLDIYEGSSDGLSGGMEHEILYENTGLSRYFATSFNYDISKFNSYIDFEEIQQHEVETDRGHYRINRVYRQLALAPAIYWQENDDQDSIYIKNQRQWVHKNLDDNIGGHLHIHKNAAFFVMEEDDCYGEYYPKDSMLSELVLLVCYEIRKRVKDEVFRKDLDECIRLRREQLIGLIFELKEKYSSVWSKEYREMELSKLVGKAIFYMEDWMLLSDNGNEITIYPAAGKITGQYSRDFEIKGGAKDA